MVKGCIEPVQLGKSGVSRKLRIIWSILIT
jgi:hypothetical protein